MVWLKHKADPRRSSGRLRQVGVVRGDDEKVSRRSLKSGSQVVEQIPAGFGDPDRVPDLRPCLGRDQGSCSRCPAEQVDALLFLPVSSECGPDQSGELVVGGLDGVEEDRVVALSRLRAEPAEAGVDSFGQLERDGRVRDLARRFRAGRRRFGNSRLPLARYCASGLFYLCRFVSFIFGGALPDLRAQFGDVGRVKTGPSANT